MTPKNINSFTKKTAELITEIDTIISDQTLINNHSVFSQRLNDFREKCLQFLEVSFDEPQNLYKVKFEENIHEVGQIYIYNKDTFITNSCKGFYLEQFDYAKKLLTQFSTTTNFIAEVYSDLPSDISEEGLYFKGQYYDAIFKLNNLIVKAKTEIKLVDNYLNSDLINFLSSKPVNVDLKIISTNTNISQIKLTLVGFEKQLKNIEIRENNSYHDRFLIIDNTEYFHFGASLKDLGNKTFMFSKINQTSIQDSIYLDFENNWKTGTVLFPLKL